MKQHKFAATVVALTSLYLLAGCASSTQASSSQEPMQMEQSETATETPSPEPTVSDSPTPAAAAKPAAAAPAATFIMPNLIGKNLQGSQDLLQSMGSYLMSQEDATSAGRVQILDRNWKVCSQDPAPGTRVSVDALVTLWNVKNNESCP